MLELRARKRLPEDMATHHVIVDDQDGPAAHIPKLIGAYAPQATPALCSLQSPAPHVLRKTRAARRIRPHPPLLPEGTAPAHSRRLPGRRHGTRHHERTRHRTREAGIRLEGARSDPVLEAR